jgi:hypothetical protein
MSNTTTEEKSMSFREVLNKAAASAARGGVAGACAMGANVACLMWMRTTVSFIFYFDLDEFIFINEIHCILLYLYNFGGVLYLLTFFMSGWSLLCIYIHT